MLTELNFDSFVKHWEEKFKKNNSVSVSFWPWHARQTMKLSTSKMEAPTGQNQKNKKTMFKMKNKPNTDNSTYKAFFTNLMSLYAA